MRQVMKADTDTAEDIPLLDREITVTVADITADTVGARAAGIMPDEDITVAADTMADVGIMAWASGSELMRLTAMRLQRATLRGFMTGTVAGKRIPVAPLLTDINA
jgi:hypothetical protein